MVVLISPDSMRSKFVRSEIQYALGDLGYEQRIFPVMVEETSSVPWILNKFKILDASIGAAEVGDAIANALKQVA